MRRSIDYVHFFIKLFNKFYRQKHNLYNNFAFIQKLQNKITIVVSDILSVSHIQPLLK